MHGTAINNVTLLGETAYEIVNGDELSFGAEVRRGLEVFPPCRFKFNLKWEKYTSYVQLLLKRCSRLGLTCHSPGFRCPESEGDDDSEEELCNQSQDDDMTPVESPVNKKSTSTEPIDLTNDEDETVLLELSKDTGTASLDEEAKFRSTGCYPGLLETMCEQHTSGHNDPIQLSSDDSDDSSDDSSDYDIDMTGLEDDSEASHDGSIGDEGSDKENEELSDDDERDSVDYLSEDEFDAELTDLAVSDAATGGRALDVKSSKPSANTPADVLLFWDNKDIPLSSMRSTLQYRRCDGTHSVREPPQDTPAGVLPFRDNEDIPVSSVRLFPPLNLSEPYRMCRGGVLLPLPHSELVSKPEAAQVPQVPKPKAVAPLDMRSPFNESVEDKPVLRVPSPSDAALPINHAPSHRYPRGLPQMVDPTDLHCGASSSNVFPRPNLSQSSEDKSRKHEYFQARVENRTILSNSAEIYKQFWDQEDAKMFSTFRYGPSEQRREPSLWVNGKPLVTWKYEDLYSPTEPVPFRFDTAKEKSDIQEEVQERIRKLEREDEKRLQQVRDGRNLPGTPLVRTRSPSGPGTCTTQEMLDEASRPVTDIRSAVKIGDIIDPIAPETSVKSNKRKAEDISDAAEEEIKIWGEKGTLAWAAKVSDAPVPAGDTSKVEEATSDVTTAAASASVAPRPAKRFKKFLERAGYAAAGGLTVGLAVFSTLVATAPDLV
jgi:hypothetical protein